MLVKGVPKGTLNACVTSLKPILITGLRNFGNTIKTTIADVLMPNLNNITLYSRVAMVSEVYLQIFKIRENSDTALKS